MVFPAFLLPWKRLSCVRHFSRERASFENGRFYRTPEGSAARAAIGDGGQPIPGARNQSRAMGAVVSSPPARETSKIALPRGRPQRRESNLILPAFQSGQQTLIQRHI